MYIYYYKYVCIHTLHITYTHIPRGSSPPTRPYIYIYMYIYIYVYIYIYIHTYIHTSRVLATLPRTRPHIYIYIYKLHITYTFVPRGSLPRTRAHIYISIYIYYTSYIHTYLAVLCHELALQRLSLLLMCALHVEETLVGGGKKKEKISQKFSTRPKKINVQSTFQNLSAWCLVSKGVTKN